MKAEIDENGKLSIIPETPLESFALKMWWADYTLSDPRQPGDTPDTPRLADPFTVLHVALIERT